MRGRVRRSLSFRKSSYSNAQGECVEVAPCSPRLIVIRDSKDAGGSCLFLSADGWRQFVSQVRGSYPARDR